MDDEAAAQYVLMLKYWYVIKELERQDFLNLKSGRLELHKDVYGNFSTVVKHQHIDLTRQTNS